MSTGSNPVFPTILYNYNISYLINLININKAKKKLYFDVFYTSKNFYFIQILKYFNYVSKYTIISKNNKNFFRIYVYFYKSRFPLFRFKLLSKPSKKFYVSLKSLKLIQKKSGASVFLISTSKGIVPHTVAIKNKLSGFIVGFFSL